MAAKSTRSRVGKLSREKNLPRKTGIAGFLRSLPRDQRAGAEQLLDDFLQSLPTDSTPVGNLRNAKNSGTIKEGGEGPPSPKKESASKASKLPQDVSSISDDELLAWVTCQDFSSRRRLVAAIVNADEADFSRYFCGNRKATPNLVNEWLNAHAGEDISSELKPMIVQALQRFRAEFNLTLRFRSDARSKPQNCNISVDKMPEPYGYRFRVYAVGQARDTLYARKALPYLSLE